MGDLIRFFDNLFRHLGFIVPQTLNYLFFQSFDFERTLCRLFVRTKFDICAFIIRYIYI
jgi:hypothetical protein